MSTEDNKAVVRRVYDEANNGRRIDALDELMAADVTSNTPFPESKTGLDGFKQVFAEVHASFPDYRVEIVEQIAEGDKVVTRYTASGTQDGKFMGLAPSGRGVTLSGIDIDRLEDGKIVEHWSEASMLGVAAQLGLIESR
jgi:steroid delta-isomerase-like uncharacterized protein